MGQLNRYSSKLLVLLIVCIFLFTACEEKKQVVKIGVVGTMSGTGSDMAVSGRRGVELALEKILETGDIPFQVELVIKDDMNDPEVSRRLVTEFIEEDVKFVIGHFTSAMQSAVMDDINDHDILYISPTASADTLSGKNDNLVKFSNVTAKQSDAIIDIAESKGQNNFSVVYDYRNTSYYEPMIMRIEERLYENKGDIITISSFGDDFVNECAEIVDKIEHKNPDAILMISNARDNIILQRQLKKKSLNIPVYASYWSNTNDLISIGGADVENTYLVDAAKVENYTDAYSVFASEYETNYGELPSFSSVFSYEAMNSLIEAINNSDRDDAEQVKNYLITKENYQGLLSDYKINKNGDCNRKFEVIQIVDGKKQDIQ